MKYLWGCATMPDGSFRPCGNWKKGFPKDSFIESKLRHAITTWNIYEGYEDGDLIKSLCAELFNIHGLLHVLLIEELERNKEKK